MYDFDFTKPATIAEAVAALADEGAQALGGGRRFADDEAAAGAHRRCW
jgi:CO/xanthine dehydrogenase FAD-binding subunit